MDHDTIDYIYTSWERLKSHPNYHETFGSLMFTRVRDLSPRLGAKFYPTEAPRGDNGAPDERHAYAVAAGRNHARVFVQMLDALVDMLGPDMDTFSDFVFQLGAKHWRYGVKSMDFPFMGQALIYALEETLGTIYFPGQVKEAWRNLWRWISLTMIRGGRSMNLDLSRKNETEQQTGEADPASDDEGKTRACKGVARSKSSDKELFEAASSGRREKATFGSSLRERIKSRSLSRGRKHRSAKKKTEDSGPTGASLSPKAPMSSKSFSRRRHRTEKFDPHASYSTAISLEESWSDDPTVNLHASMPSIPLSFMVSSLKRTPLTGRRRLASMNLSSEDAEKSPTSIMRSISSGGKNNSKSRSVQRGVSRQQSSDVLGDETEQQPRNGRSSSLIRRRHHRKHTPHPNKASNATSVSCLEGVDMEGDTLEKDTTSPRRSLVRGGSLRKLGSFRNVMQRR